MGIFEVCYLGVPALVLGETRIEKLIFAAVIIVFDVFVERIANA